MPIRKSLFTKCTLNGNKALLLVLVFVVILVIQFYHYWHYKPENLFQMLNLDRKRITSEDLNHVADILRPNRGTDITEEEENFINSRINALNHELEK